MTTNEKLEILYQHGYIVFSKNGVPRRKGYLEDMKGVKPDNIWTDIPIAGAKERTDYPTQKPLALLHRIIKSSSNQGDIVLDPFCGSGTTCYAAQQLDRKWVGVDLDTTTADKRMSELLSDWLL